MKKFITILLLLVLGLNLSAQDFTKVKGVVVDASGNPIAGAIVTAVGTKVSTKTGSGGSFELMIPGTVNYVRVQKSMYLAKNAPVSSSMRVVLEIDKVAAEKAAAAKAAAERAAAEKAAAERAAAERAAAEKARIEAEKARAEAEARARAAAEARAKAVRDSLAAVEKARLEAEARARAAAEARAKAVRDSIAAVEARAQAVRDSIAAAEARAIFVRDSIAAAEARAIFVRDSTAAALKQQKIEARKAAEAEYNGKYKNRGIENTFEFGYAYQLLIGDLKEDLRYQYSGYRAVSPRHPVFVDYTFSYRFNRYFSLGVGAGFMYNLKSVVIKNDWIVGTDENWKEKRFDIPVYLDLKARFCRKAVRPLVDIKGGWYPMSKTAFIDGGFGVEFRTSRSTALNLTASIRTTPFFTVKYDEISPKLYYSMCWSPSVRIGFAF